MRELAFTTVVQQAHLVASGEVTARQLAEHSLARIAELNPRLNAFVRVLADEARAQAHVLDAVLESGDPVGPLHGVPIAIKDENDVAGLSTNFGGAAVSRIAPDDGEVVRRLRAAGAIIIGTTRMPEFGIWPYTETAAHGYTRNPWEPLRSPAGSSGGTAAAVASGMVAGASAVTAAGPSVCPRRSAGCTG